MNDFITIFLQALQRHKFSEDFEDLKLEIQVEPFPRVFFTVNSGALVFAKDFAQSDIVMTGNVAQWSKLLLSQGKDRSIKVHGDAGKLEGFQQEINRILIEYQSEIPSILEVLTTQLKDSTEHQVQMNYLTKEKFNEFKKDVLDISNKIDMLEQKIQKSLEE